jgi:CHASE2 domain-containing sensor protein
MHPDAVEEQIRGKNVFLGIAIPRGLNVAAPRPVLGVKDDAALDQYVTPIGDRAMYGVEIHATIFDNLRHASWIKRAVSRDSEPGTVLVFALLLNWVLCLARGVVKAVIVALIPVTWLVTFYVFFVHGYFLPGASQALGALPLCGVLVLWLDHVRARRSISSIEATLKGVLRK